MRTVLVIDDNPAVGTALDVLFGLHDIRTVIATSPAQGLELLASENIDLVVQDMNFSADTTSGEEGMELYRAIRRDYSDLPIILLTAWTRLETAVELVKAGASDYLGKPWDDNKLLATVENLLELSEATREVSRHRDERRRRRRQLDERFDLRGIVFSSSGMERVVELACQVARADVPVLITGPNGAGKERIAEIVLANSARAKGPFITVNCGALPSELIEAELFGAEPGAYTGAPNRAREGRFEAADGGTLFLDEIGNLPLAGQMKLLRILETGQFERLGSSKTRKVSVRVISATNSDLPSLIREGQFREDLFYRLNVIELKVPPLAERSDDILPLAEHFLQGRASFDSGARSALSAHAWPGNVRELKNAIDRASLLCSDGIITARDLTLEPARGSGRRLSPDEEPDKSMIEAALQRARGVISQAAADLGLSRQALYRRMEKMGIET
ncbi:MAG TPA: sigma-54 dependent transcriptional regulator [Dokdonella sp.]|uniref:sigma-54-dependent transcriptional regulator n=1 Tax=Dokdonella sp. TaxID=2291710 RepID=UPI002D80E3B3|nr:sigma-54 dependent transcriptional regulator [Dokdonella sp.]HET9033407.1 sigma-54 dependent transcriptional regulator [Dokdonella sp.]